MPVQQENNSYLRIHIRANSNAIEDQTVKYEIKNKLVEALIPVIANCTSKAEVMTQINNNKFMLQQVSNRVLQQHQFLYQTNLNLKTEYFPTRMYDGVVLESGVYDAVIVELGEAKGNNWWCVVYPPLCFVNETGNRNIVYKSKLIELIKIFFK
jgi:stage II sporulation protein R